MKPDYKNWVPKGMVYGLVAGTGVLTAAFAVSLAVLKKASTPVRVGTGIVLGLGALGCGKFAQWSIMAYRQFSYDGKRQLSKQIIEGTAEYVKLPEGGKGLDVGCGSGALTIACAKRNPQGSFIGIDRWGKEYASFSKTLCKSNASAEGVSNTEFRQGDATKLDFPDETFDVVLVWAQTFGLLYGEDYKLECMAEWKRVLKKGGLVSFSAHDYRYLEEHHPDCLQGRKFYPYANAHIYWEAFEAPELIGFADRAGLEVILYEKGRIYKPEDGTVLHCLCRK
jgi:ubiquinone/menaquinone biosynthesis C-methylase UbiE